MLHTDHPRPRVALYVRTASGDKTEEQRTRCRIYAQKQGWIIVQEYSDSCASGAILDNPSMQALLTAVADREFDIVLVASLDRIARSIALLAVFGSALVRADIALHRVDSGQSKPLDLAPGLAVLPHNPATGFATTPFKL
jgi:DNA invertase Pin-like site-specific DNA recombinase